MCTVWLTVLGDDVECVVDVGEGADCAAEACVGAYCVDSYVDLCSVSRYDWAEEVDYADVPAE